MTLTAGRLAALVLALAIASPPVVAQTYPQSQTQRAYSQAELDQMLAPIALYPDALLSQLLMAATYPLEIAEAARWSRAHPGLQGDDAARAAQIEGWDPSVTSLVAFPQILTRMDENPDWTRRLGEAFLAQEPHVIDTVQQLRQRAQAAGTLQSSEQIHVQQQGQAILLEPADPQYVYVPYYDPRAVYGQWWWPAYQPVVWAPWPGNARPYRPGISVGLWWGRPVGLSPNFFFGKFDWRSRHVRVARPAAYYYRPPVAPSRTAVVISNRWQQEPRQREPLADRPLLQARQPVQVQPQVQREVRAQPAIRAHPEPRAQAQVQVHHEQRARMPEPMAPQQPRAERRDPRHEPRNGRGDKGRDRS